MDDTVMNMTGIPMMMVYTRMHMEQRSYEHPKYCPSRNSSASPRRFTKYQ